MTRKEAIKNLKELLECNYVDSFEDDENEALRMAIKELEQGEKFAEFRKRFQEALVKADVFRIIADDDRFFDTAESEDQNV